MIISPPAIAAFLFFFIGMTYANDVKSCEEYQETNPLMMMLPKSSFNGKTPLHENVREPRNLKKDVQDDAETLAPIFHHSRDEEVAKADGARQKQDFDQGYMSTYCPDQNSSLTQHSSDFPAFAVERGEIFGLEQRSDQSPKIQETGYSADNLNFPSSKTDQTTNPSEEPHSIKSVSRLNITPELLTEKVTSLKAAKEKLNQAILQAEENYSLIPILEPSEKNKTPGLPIQKVEMLIREALASMDQEKENAFQQVQEKEKTIEALIQKLITISDELKYQQVPSFRSLLPQERQRLESLMEDTDCMESELQQNAAELRAASAPSAYAFYFAHAAEQALVEFRNKIENVKKYRPNHPKAISELLEPALTANIMTTLALSSARYALATAIIDKVDKAALIASGNELTPDQVSLLEKRVTTAADLVGSLQTLKNGNTLVFQEVYIALSQNMSFQDILVSPSQFVDPAKMYKNFYPLCHLDQLVLPSPVELVKQLHELTLEAFRQDSINLLHPYSGQPKTRYSLNEILQHHLESSLAQISETSMPEFFQAQENFQLTVSWFGQSQMKLYLLKHSALSKEALFSLACSEITKEMQQANSYKYNDAGSFCEAHFPVDSPHFPLHQYAQQRILVAHQVAKEVNQALSQHQENDPLKSLEVILAKEILGTAVKAAQPLVKISTVWEKKYDLQDLIASTIHGKYGLLSHNLNRLNTSLQNPATDQKLQKDVKKLNNFFNEVKAAASTEAIEKILYLENLPERTWCSSQDFSNWVKIAYFNKSCTLAAIAKSARQALPALMRIGQNGTSLFSLTTLNTKTPVQNQKWHKMMDRFYPLQRLLPLLSSCAFLDSIDVKDLKQKTIFDQTMEIVINAAKTSKTISEALAFAGLLVRNSYQDLESLKNRIGGENMLQLETLVANIQREASLAYGLATKVMDAYDNYYNALTRIDTELVKTTKKPTLNLPKALKEFQAHINSINQPFSVPKELSADNLQEAISDSKAILERVEGMKTQIKALLPIHW
ncbi:MAG: hypothetical protein K2W97_00235 [Chthoniobacterales bacterium]|nr:hypothetical protein [Chthoniobacterales bacterium]